jgi:hypothetical protein
MTRRDRADRSPAPNMDTRADREARQRQVRHAMAAAADRHHPAERRDRSDVQDGTGARRADAPPGRCGQVGPAMGARLEGMRSRVVEWPHDLARHRPHP